MKMHEEIDIEKLAEEPVPKSVVDAALGDFGSFKPMRRKLHIPSEAYH